MHLVRSHHPAFRLLAILPFVLAMGVWIGHLVLRCDLVEHHRDFPISLSSTLAPLPEVPEPVLTAAPPAPAPTLVVLWDETLRDNPDRILSTVRGPPC